MIVLDCLTIVVALVATLTCWRIMRRAESAAAAQAVMTLSIGFRVTAVEHQPDGTILITGASLT